MGARILAYVTGTVDQELLARNEYAWAMAVGVDLGIVALERRNSPSTIRSAFIRLTNSYNGLRAPAFDIGFHRKVCKNGLIPVYRDAVGITTSTCQTRQRASHVAGKTSATG